MLLVSIVGLTRLSFDTDVLSLLPRDSRVIQSFRDYLARFGSLEGLYVVFTSPDGHPISEYNEDISTWVERLRAAPEIGRVDPGVVDRSRDFAWLADRQLLVLKGRPLDQAIERLRPRGMMDAVAARRELLTVPSSEVAELIRQDPAGLFDLLRDALGGTQAGFGVGVSGGGYVTPDGHSRLIIARPTHPSYDAEFSRALDARLHEIEASISHAEASRHRPASVNDADDDADARPPLAVGFAGGHRIAVETEAFVRRESILNTVESLALILPLLFVVFRSAWLVAVGSLPSALSLVVVLGALGFSGVTLSAAATGAAAMIFGLGVDGVVLLYVAHRLAVAENPAVDVPAALSGPSASMLLGMWTTAATFYGLMFVDFPSLQQLGRLIGHSMFVCGILTLVMVPALLPRRSTGRPGRALLLMPGLARWIERHRRVILVVSAVLTCALGFSATRIHVNPTLERLRSVTDAARLETKIASAFGLPSDVYVVIAEGPQLEPLLQTNERLAERLAAVPGLAFQPPTRLLPSEAAQARTVAQIGRAQLSPAAVRAALEQARVASGFTPGAFDPFSARVPRLLDPAARLSYEGYVAHGLNDLIDRFVVRDGNRWTLATYVFPTNADAVVSPADDRRRGRSSADPDRLDDGQPGIGARFPPAVHQGPGDRYADRDRARRGSIPTMAPVDVRAAADSGGLGLDRRNAGGRRLRARSVCGLRRRHLRRHRRRLRRTPRASVSGAGRRVSRDGGAGASDPRGGGRHAAWLWNADHLILPAPAFDRRGIGGQRRGAGCRLGAAAAGPTRHTYTDTCVTHQFGEESCRP